MFCNKCGQKNTVDAKFCSNCGNKFENQNIPMTTLKKLWNPNVAFILGFFFTFIFSSIIFHKNWKELGFEKKMIASNLMIILLFLFALYSLYYMHNSGNIFLSSFYVFYPTILGVNIWFMVLLYFISAKTQIDYINLNYKAYQKKSFIEYSLFASILIAVFYFQLKLALLGLI
ncbi:zinc-ribbon domain-containing protein [Acinetobacter bereziniae]|uniref:zinc ribbon domain-containing protein n=1 Tax=Acinetobacter bereziniae TaxID=106648 RepID=UPI003AFAD6F1